MFGLTFLEPAFLLGLLAAPLPVLIHLFQRRRARLVAWSSLEFVRPYQRPRTSRLDLRRLFLLTLRVLTLVLLALALARPTLPGSANANAPTDAVIVLDSSLSMSARGLEGGESLFEQARERAARVLDLMRSGDRAAILPAGNPAAPLPRLTDDFAAVRAALADAQPSPGRLAWDDALARAWEILAPSREANREIYLVSDLQRSGWEGMLDSAPGTPSSAGPSRGAVAALAEARIPIFVISVGPLPAENLSLDALRMSPSGAFSLQALVRNHGVKPAEGVAVDLVTDDGISHTAVTSVSPEDAVWVSIEGRAPAGTFVQGHVTIPPDAVLLDNVRSFGLPRPHPLRVLVVGRPSAGAPSGLSSRYLRQALVPEPNDSRYEVQEVAARDLTQLLLSDADVVILADCERLGPGVASSLQDLVRGGAGLLIFVGPGTDLGFMNQVFLPDLLPIQLENLPEDAGGESDFGWAAVDARHPIFAVFDGHPSEALSRARFARCLRAVPGPEVKILASFQNGAPALLEGKHGQGRVLLFTSAPDLSWGNFPLSGNFLPFIHEAVRYLAAWQPTVPGGYVVGESPRREMSLAAAETGEIGAGGLGIQLSGPDGKSSPILPEVAGRKSILSLGPLAQAGVYRIERGEDLLDVFAVNPDPRESLPACLTPEEAAAALGPARVVTGGSAGQLAGAVRALRYGREVAGPFLWIVLLLLFAELIVRGGFALPARRSRAERRESEVSVG